MGINSKVSKIRFPFLYGILALLVSYNWIRVILYQKDFEVFRSEQPWDYYLSNFFASAFGITHKQYFLLTLPLVLLALYAVPKLGGKLIDLDKTSNVKGDNHIAVLLILLIVPFSFGIHKLLGGGWRNHLIPSFLLIVLFSIFSWMDEKKSA